jgi:hypothetical protein
MVMPRSVQALGKRPAVHIRIACANFLPPGDEMGEGLVGQSALGLVVERILIHGLELTLPWRMIHQRRKPDLTVGPEIGEMIEHIRR